MSAIIYVVIFVVVAVVVALFFMPRSNVENLRLPSKIEKVSVKIEDAIDTFIQSRVLTSSVLDLYADYFTSTDLRTRKNITNANQEVVGWTVTLDTWLNGMYQKSAKAGSSNMDWFTNPLNDELTTNSEYKNATFGNMDAVGLTAAERPTMHATIMANPIAQPRYIRSTEDPDKFILMLPYGRFMHFGGTNTKGFSFPTPMVSKENTRIKFPVTVYMIARFSKNSKGYVFGSGRAGDCGTRDGAAVYVDGQRASLRVEMWGSDTTGVASDSYILDLPTCADKLFYLYTFTFKTNNRPLIAIYEGKQSKVDERMMDAMVDGKLVAPDAESVEEYFQPGKIDTESEAFDCTFRQVQGTAANAEYFTNKSVVCKGSGAESTYEEPSRFYVGAAPVYNKQTKQYELEGNSDFDLARMYITKSEDETERNAIAMFFTNIYRMNQLGNDQCLANAIGFTS